MIEELKPTEFGKAKYLFINNNQQLPVFSIINGSHPGRIFVDNLNDPKAAIAWAIGRWAYIDGKTDISEFNQSIAKFFKEIVIPDSINKLKMDWFELYVGGDPNWENIIDQAVKEFDSSKHFESVYTWDSQKYNEFRATYKFPTDVSVKKSDLPMLADTAQKSSLVSKKFKNKTTFGFKVMSKNQELTLCRSTGFELEETFMIDVITHDANHRKKGYATMACVGLLDFALENNLVPLWETTEDNFGSQRLAQKLGFIKNQTYPVFAIEF